MRILFIGDVIGDPGIAYLKQHLFSYRKLKQIDLCIANGENSASAGKGVSKKSVQGLYDSGVDAITLGNHCYAYSSEMEGVFGEDFPVARPANLHPSAPGKNHVVVQTPIGNVAIINLLGRIYMQPTECPFLYVDKLLDELEDKTDIILVDFHAEATSEKLIMLDYLDGRVSAVVGTHTHVQTADERVTDKGTAYITDLGMTGPVNSILGITAESARSKIVYQIPRRFEVADGPCKMEGLIIDVDEKGRAVYAERVSIS